jgi:Helix-turn-helix domain
MADISPTIPRRQLGRLLRDLRQATGLTIAELARHIERGQSACSDWKQEAPTGGQFDPPSWVAAH